MNRADWRNLTAWLAARGAPQVRVAWDQFETIVGGLPASAVNHYPQWWHGDRPNTRAWRAAGYELESVELGRWALFRRVDAPVDHRRSVSSSRHRSLGRLPDDDASAAMIILECSERKERGGDPPSSPPPSIWPAELDVARQQVAANAKMDTSQVMPAWKRYTGTFYKCCQTTLVRATSEKANIVIVSGGFGLVAATEAICWYDTRFKLSDWQPPGCLERALLQRAARTRAQSVIAFASTTSDYAKLIRRTAWELARVPVYLVTRLPAQDGAMAKAPKALALALNAYWNRTPETAPSDISVERLA